MKIKWKSYQKRTYQSVAIISSKIAKYLFRMEEKNRCYLKSKKRGTKLSTVSLHIMSY